MTVMVVSAILALFLNFNVKFLIFHFLTTNINGNNILLVTTYFNLNIAYFSKAAFTIVYYILIDIIWKKGFSSRVKLKNTDLSKGKICIVTETANRMS